MKTEKKIPTKGLPMKTKPMKAAFLAGTVLALLSCITVNIYFPEGEVKKTAEDIVNDVRGGEKGKKEEVKNSTASAAFSLLPSLYAQQETQVSSPRIRGIKESIRARFDQLVPHFDAGRLGEGNNGYLQSLKEEGLSLQERSVLRKLLGDENKDRKDLYGEVAKALNVDAKDIDRVGKIFADQWIGKARAGWMIQKPDGSWAKKS